MNSVFSRVNSMKDEKKKKKKVKKKKKKFLKGVWLREGRDSGI